MACVESEPTGASIYVCACLGSQGTHLGISVGVFASGGSLFIHLYGCGYKSVTPSSCFSPGVSPPQPTCPVLMGTGAHTVTYHPGALGCELREMGI